MDIPNDLVHISNLDFLHYQREKTDNGFNYLDEDGQLISDKPELERIKSLVIPPSWEKVQICKNPKGHVQAIGYDDKGRKQYIYHPRWNEYRQKDKFEKLLPFSNVLPELRKAVSKDLQIQNWTKKKVLALTVRVLDLHYLRIGNLNYQRRNKTFGLTTLRRKHLEEKDERLKISYKAKSGKYRKIAIENPTLYRLVKETAELPGYEVFRYLDKRGRSQTIDSQDVNDYLKDLTHGVFTAKVFRTWGGTKLAIEYLTAAKEEVKANPRKKLETTLVRLVAKRLGNKVSTCRKYYIHPDILDQLVESNERPFLDDVDSSSEYLDDSELVLINMLRQDQKT